MEATSNEGNLSGSVCAAKMAASAGSSASARAHRVESIVLRLCDVPASGIVQANSMAGAKLNHFEGHLQRTRRYLRQSMLHANLLSGVTIEAAENLGSLLDSRRVELGLDGEIDALTLQSLGEDARGN